MVQSRHAHLTELYPPSLADRHRYPSLLQRSQLAQEVHQDRMAVTGDGPVPDHDVRLASYWTADLGYHP